MKYLFLLLFIPAFSFAQEFPAQPNPPRLVTDFTGTLSAQETAALEQKLVAYNDSTSTQIAIVMLSSTGEYAIDDYSFQLAEKWGIGQKGKNNGVLILVAKDDHKMFIATGYGMEGVMPDGLVKRIVESDIKPYFKQGDYYGGLDKGTDSMFRLAAGEYKGEPKKSNKEAPLPFIGIILFVIIIVLALRVRTVQKYAIVNNISFLAAWMMLSQARRMHSGSWGGFSGGGSSWGGGGGGGGFGGFGGGSFGGGGAGGSW